ncbi:hypothetical protein H310_01145 [Aphanomyces invadans]|uniref:Uncharacterized protein n=1 Tax=Aphanomyces invadans TaxID=157072 RepID=A0A024UQ79_9STRA|nr:hypothetical protein H310_01145 [Aphanomyces invadans]ETW08601.1 hypothetical protein H310_01145 [Aphanomyces invadans]|eukprot:XP_008862406.1 hypothetical protein H310_01145 [Aphanomyces invadans]
MMDDPPRDEREPTDQDEGGAVNESLQADTRLVALLQSGGDLTEAVMENFQALIDPFQEQGQLLDPILRDMVTPVVRRIQDVISSMTAASQPLKGTAFPFQVLNANTRTQLHRACHIVYLLCKVRGYKTIVKLLPHDVVEFEPVLLLLHSQDHDDHTTWEIRFVLLLWLSILALVPFDLKSIDSTMDGHEAHGESISIVADIIAMCKMYLQDSGPTQQAAALCLARLLSRPDMEDQYLMAFLEYVKFELDSFCMSSQTGDSTPTQTRILQYKTTGIMLCLSYICKFTPRDKYILMMGDCFGHVMAVMETIRALDADAAISSTVHRKLSTKLLQRMGVLYLPPKVMTWRYSRGMRSLEANLTKKTQEEQVDHAAGVTQQFVDADDEMEVPEELEQVIDALLCGLRDRDTVVRWSAAKGVGRVTSRLPFEFADDIVEAVLELFSVNESDAAWHGASLAIAELSRRCVLLPERLPEAVRVIGLALMYDIRRGAHSIGAHVRDAACYACWSFARAYDPALFLPYLKNTLAPIMLTVCAFDRELNCRRAAAAAFQESVGRQGVANFPHGIDLLTKADYFTLASVSHAYVDVSRHIAKYAEYRYSLMDHVASVKLFHWDVNIRVLSSNAIGLLAPLDVSYTITSILPSLLVASISPTSDVIVRHGATLAVSEIALQIASVPAFFDGEIIRRIKLIPIEMDKRRLYRGRGGEMIRAAVCSLIQSICKLGWPLSVTIVKKYLVTIEECIKNPNEVVRDCAVAAYEELANRCLSKLQEAAEHTMYINSIVPRFLSSVKDKAVLNPNVAVRRGFLKALGVTPFTLLQPHMQDAVDLMILAAVMSYHTPDEQDAESRVAAIQALVNFTTKNRAAIDLAMLTRIMESILKCANEDYSMDERGDVGSWVRKEAMVGLQAVITRFANDGGVAASAPTKQRVHVRGFGSGTVIETRELKRKIVAVQFDKPNLGYFYFSPHGIGKFPDHRVHDEANMVGLPSLADRRIEPSSAMPLVLVPPAIVSQFCLVLVKQLSEKLDSVRSVAGTILHQLVTNATWIDGIPDRPVLAPVVQSPDVNWSMAHVAYPMVVALLDSPSYIEAVVAGLVVSVGGLTESVVKASKNCLLGWLKTQLKLNNFKAVSAVAHRCVALFEKHTKDDRVVIPLMKTIAYCLEEGVFDVLHKDGAGQFGNALYDAVRIEIGKSSNVNKISAGLTVLVGLLPSEPSVEKRCLRGICVCLGHRFPKVRKLTAEKLYTRLLLHEDVLNDNSVGQVLSVLSDTVWDAGLDVARSKRDVLVTLLNLDKIEARDSSGASKPSTKGTQGDDHSYQSLVKEMGY